MLPAGRREELSLKLFLEAEILFAQQLLQDSLERRRLQVREQGPTRLS